MNNNLNSILDGSTTVMNALITAVFSVKEQMKVNTDLNKLEGLMTEHHLFLSEFFERAFTFGSDDGKGNMTVTVDDIGDCLPWFCINNPELFTDEVLDAWYADFQQYNADEDC